MTERREVRTKPAWDIERIAQRAWGNFFDGDEDERDPADQLQAAREAAEEAVQSVDWGQPWLEDREPTDEEFEDAMVAIATEILHARK